MSRIWIVCAAEDARARLAEWAANETGETPLTNPDAPPEGYDALVAAAPGTEALALRAAAETPAGVIALTRARDVTALESAGVLCLRPPLSREAFCRALRLALATNARMRAAYDRERRLESKLEETRAVSRAKLALIATLKMSEAQAHRYIEKQAMDQRVTRREVAESLIKTYEN